MDKSQPAPTSTLKQGHPASHQVTSSRNAYTGYRALVDGSPDLLIAIDLSHNVVFMNRTGLEVTGFTADEVRGKSITFIMAPPSSAVIRKALANPSKSRSLNIFNVDLVTKAGQELPLEMNTSVLSRRNRAVGYVLSGRLITSRRFASTLFERFSSNSPVCAFIVSDGTFKFVNEQFIQCTGFSESELLAQDRLALVHPKDKNIVEENMRKMMAGKRTAPYEYRFVNKTGEVRWFIEAITATEHEGREAWFGNSIDITAQKLVEERLNHLAFYDSLTELPSRALFMQRLEQALTTSAVTMGSLAVMFLDVDRFKVVNDSLGHNAGDQVLFTIGQRLKDSIRPGDTLARFGGDEFTILLEGLAAPSDAELVAERMLRAVQECIRLGERDAYLTASIGISFAENGDESPAQLLQHADLALYRAKAEGKARFAVFDPAVDVGAEASFNLESALWRAIDADEFRLHFQPKLRLDGQKIVGVEAVVRWQHPERGLLLPEDFLQASEDCGAIVPIGDWVLREACRQLREWQLAYEQDPPLIMSVNVSVRQLERPTSWRE